MDLKYLIHCVRISALLVFAHGILWGQNNVPRNYTMQDVLAHNDYQKSPPFTTAYKYGVGIFEADLILHDGRVKVAHDSSEFHHNWDLEEIYLKPLKRYVIRRGSPYPDPKLKLALMLDIKSHPEKIMTWIRALIGAYPELFGSSDHPVRVPIIISGIRPPINTWADLPASIFIDGRLTDSIPISLRSRVYMVSSSFSSVVPGSWNRGQPLSSSQIAAIRAAVDQVHQQGLKIRFWGVPDQPYFWKLQGDLGVDIIGSDHLAELARYISDN